jgi:hypothetical protein
MRDHIRQTHPGTMYGPDCDACKVIDALLTASPIVALSEPSVGASVDQN